MLLSHTFQIQMFVVDGIECCTVVRDILTVYYLAPGFHSSLPFCCRFDSVKMKGLTEIEQHEQVLLELFSIILELIFV